MSSFSKTSVFTTISEPVATGYVVAGWAGWAAVWLVWLACWAAWLAAGWSHSKHPTQCWLAGLAGLLGQRASTKLPYVASSGNLLCQTTPTFFPTTLALWVSFSPIPEWQSLQCWNHSFSTPSVHRTDHYYSCCCALCTYPAQSTIKQPRLQKPKFLQQLIHIV